MRIVTDMYSCFRWAVLAWFGAVWLSGEVGKRGVGEVLVDGANTNDSPKRGFS